MGIPDAILHNPAGLQADEWAFMRCHTLIGERIVRAAPALAATAELIRGSHERFDRTGYPDGLAGDAIVSDRPYRSARTHAEALDELRAGGGVASRQRHTRGSLPVRRDVVRS